MHAEKIWDLLPNDIKGSKSLEIFKNKVKNWKPDASVDYAKPMCLI